MNHSRFGIPSARSIRGRGFTLVEVMVSAVLMALTLLGFLTALSEAYRTTAISRHREQARALLQSKADEFMRLPIYLGTGVDRNLPQGLFEPTTTETGTGLQWTGGIETAAGLKIRLGADPSNPTDPTLPEITITREVHFLRADGTWNTDAGAQDVLSNAGRMMVATFRGRYTVSGRSQVETLTIARNTK